MSPSSAERVTPSWSYTLGLARGRGNAYPVIAELRAEAMRGRRLLWLGANLLAMLVVCALRYPMLGWHTLLPWGSAILGIEALVLLGVWRAPPPQAPWRDADVLGGFFLGLCWAVAMALFTASGGIPYTLSLVAVGGALAACATALLVAAPIGGLAFITIVGTAAVADVAMDGRFVFAGMAALFTLAVIGTFIANARLLIHRISAEQALAGKEEVISLLLREFEDTSADWLWRTDAAKCLVDVSPRFARLFGARRDQLEGKSLLAVLAGEGWDHGDVAPGIRMLADKLRLRESFRDLVVPVMVGGERRWWSLSAAPRRDERGALIGFWGVGTDATERHRSAERIDRMARFDALTGLANRAHVIERLGEALAASHRNGNRSTLMLIDLDRFKQVNDTLGHPIGDKLLIEVANRISALLAPGDVCGRLGGDEFAVVLPDANDRDRVDVLAERIVLTLSRPFEIEGNELHIGGSVGSATAPLDGRVVETLLRNADLALYRAKDDGRGVHRRYEPSLHAQAEHKRRIEIALRDALERRELSLVYQPIVEAQKGGLTGFEAFLRWTHPELGNVSPEVFIPVAEEARLIGRIGDWVMHSACRDAVTWPDHIRVSVNMAAAQLKDPQLPATIIAALSHSGLAPERLELEVAEEVFVRDGSLTGVVDKILALGVRITLDDFGTGKSSLAYLRKARFSSIKIDRSFVRGAAGNGPESVAIVKAIVAMAESLGMATIAEGAETRNEFDKMRGLGCRQIQGWLVGQPVGPQEAAEIAHTRGQTEDRLLRVY
ncbi:EAL domain-containing protein [Sphingomonas sp. CGMCC 1.13654]|uniref:EAL domain-containing protein n=1 Tax=Sphingomonas chungangi TaxID=2683589 RepID=A0A838L430_9SPHN|nr:EAL domain-containing protein [Sphingomonas chungangi]MBA2934253.1 EAL domain-containing protein [Sphingomonas chungangi]MVW57294.1 EAL domain-containing protein [Sphingomonas chungangi]